MVNEVAPFHIGLALLIWAAIVCCSALLGMGAGLVAAFATHGSSGFRVWRGTIRQGFRDLFFLSGRRILAVALLTFKEAWRRKAFTIGFLFVVLFMFAGWFLGGADLERPAKPYISFVMTSMTFLLVLMSLLVSCWGLPADIKARSLHTVVTKPVRRSEIVLGRMLGYASVVSLVLVATSLLGYIWINRQLPKSVRETQLIARVPRYGTVSYLDMSGKPAMGGVNTGDVWTYRTFLSGGTKAAAIWTFNDLDLAGMEKQGNIRLEEKFEAFRTVKGDIRQPIRFSLTLVNPKTGLRVLAGNYPVREFSEGSEDAVILIPRTLSYRDSYEVGGQEKTADVFKDLVHDGKLTIEVNCLDPSQYLGVAQRDLFIRMPDRPFWITYFKSCVGLWMLLLLVVMIGTTASCFLKGPVATMLTAALIFTGYAFRERLGQMLGQLISGQGVIGGGMFESMYRMVTQMNQTTPLPENVGTKLIWVMDQGIWGILYVVRGFIPDLQYYDTAVYSANGFDVPWTGVLLPSLLITLGYFIPLVVLGYFALQLRELEHK